MKQLLIAALLSATLSAESFEAFLQSAVEKSPFLKANHLQIEQSAQEGSALTRYENPNLELEASYFNPDVGSGDMGYRAAYAQPIRLWGVGDNKEELADANLALSKANYIQARAAFERDISLQYTNYAESNKMLALSLEELSIASNIFKISEARYEAGSVSRGIMLQAKIDLNMVVARVQTLKLTKQRQYYNLLKNAGITEEITVDTEHTFKHKTSINAENPEILQLKNRQKSALSNAEVNTNKVEWMSFVGEYEKEPDQEIFRFGASIPLAFFNTKTQEKQIATLEAQRNEMLNTNAQNQLSIELKRLNFESEALAKLQEIDEEILKDEKELLKMYESGYKIANINLLALQDAKSRLIETKERLIKIKIERDRNAIIQNYLQGNYND